MYFNTGIYNGVILLISARSTIREFRFGDRSGSGGTFTPAVQAGASDEATNTRAYTMVGDKKAAGESSWTFLTNHAHVLVCIAEDPDIRGRDIADLVGITERAAQAIVADLVTENYVTRTKVGRRNRYSVNPDAPLRHPLEHDHTIGELLTTLGRLKPKRATRR